MLAGVMYTFSGWIKAFPTQTEKAQKVARCLLKKIIPPFRIPVSTGSAMGWPLWLRWYS
jgi:hypothetical protein